MNMPFTPSGVLDVCRRLTDAADELARIREDGEAEMLRMIAAMDANQVAYFMKEVGREGL